MLNLSSSSKVNTLTCIQGSNHEKGFFCSFTVFKWSHLIWYSSKKPWHQLSHKHWLHSGILWGVAVPWWTLLLQSPCAKDGYAIWWSGCCGRCEYVHTGGKYSASFSDPSSKSLNKTPKHTLLRQWQLVGTAWIMAIREPALLSSWDRDLKHHNLAPVIWAEIFHVLKEQIFLKWEMCASAYT